MRTGLLLATLGAVMVGIAGLELLPSATTNPSTDTGGPANLSISIDDRQAKVAPGDRVHYTVRVHNAGERTYPDARIVQQLPAALTSLTSRPASDQNPSGVGWTATLPPGADATFSMTGRVGESRGSYPEVVTTGCVSSRPGAAPLACDSDSDALLLPDRSPLGSVLLFGIGGTIGVGVLVVRHWPRRERQPVRPLPLPQRRPFRRRRSPRPVYVGSRDTVPVPMAFVGGSSWSSTNPARGPPALPSERRPGV